MRLRRLAAAAVVLLSSVALVGCELYRALSFEGDEVTSYKKADAAATINVSNDAYCGAEEQKVIAPALAAAAVGIALNLAESEIQGYLDRKKQQFTATDNASASGPAEYARTALGGRGLSASFDCVHLIRSITEKGERGDEPVLAFETYVRIETAPGGQAQRLVPRSLTLARAAALTDRQSRKVDTSVEIKIDAIAGGEKIIEKVAVADQTLKFAGLQTPGGENGKPNPSKTIYDCDAAIQATKDAKRCRNLPRSSWFPAIPKTAQDMSRCTKDPTCKGITPFTVSALVTETGSGGDDFGTLSKDIDDNKKTLNDAITSTIKDALTKTTTKK
jgi:hypothetical protein